MRRLIILSTAVGVSLCGLGQSLHNNSWSYNFYLGASNMLGDLGGNQGDGTFGIKDFDARAIRPAIGVGGSYNTKRASLNSNLLYTRLVGNDAFTDVRGRSVRNLSVRTDLVELNLLGEIRPFSSSFMKRLYVFGGVGGIFYQPKAEYNGEWVKLRPLGTEGQLLNGDGTYDKFSLVLPYGAGYKFPLGSRSTLNLNVGIRKTFTDYLDDVSTVYANTGALLESSGAIAAALADRSGLNLAEGAQRGNPSSMDSYFVVGLKFEKNIGGGQTSCYYDDAPMPSKRKIRKHQRRMFRR